MTISTNAPQSSEITGPVSAGATASNAIGRLRSGMALANTAPAAALAKLTPQETNARMEACLERISGRRPVFGRRMMFPENGPAYSITEAASWKCATESQRNEALAAVEFALRPAGEDEIGAALYTLRIMTRGRDQRTDADREAEGMIWLSHLQQFPADIVLTTLRNWPKRHDGQWWPTWHDVQKELDAMTSGRRLLAEHIRSSKCLPKPEAAEPERDDSPEGIAARQAFIERHKRKLDYPQPAPFVPPEAFKDWEQRQIETIASEGLPQLSDEAKALFREQSERAVPSPAEQFDEWNRTTGKERAA
jgi:hypothetical protein